MDPITGSSSIKLPSPSIEPAGPPGTYLGVARHLMSGAEVLAVTTPLRASALAFLAAHVLECLLKAYLSREGDDTRLRKRNLRHNLKALWALAVSEGLELEDPPPEWATRLSRLHKPPYYLRYSTDVHGIVLPDSEPMTTELEGVLELVERRV